MRVLVTGSAGFIGKAVVAELRRLGHESARFDAFDGYDIRDRHVVEVMIANVDAVINLAGVLGTEEMFGAEHDAVLANVIGAVNVYDAAAKAGVPVVQIGTGHKGQPNPYAITKACAEDLGLARARWAAERIVVVRAFHVYGPGQKACPPHGTSPVRKIVPSMVCRALMGMDVEVNGSGNQLIDLVHVDDVAAVLVDALHEEPGTVVEAGTGKPTSVLQAARDVIAVCGSSSRVVHRPDRRGEPADTTVVAESPACRNPWPYRLDETVDFYRRMLG